MTYTHTFKGGYDPDRPSGISITQRVKEVAASLPDDMRIEWTPDTPTSTDVAQDQTEG
jgi:hypothetical protein